MSLVKRDIYIGHTEVHYFLYFIFGSMIPQILFHCLQGIFYFKKKKKITLIFKKNTHKNLLYPISLFFGDKQMKKIFKSKEGTIMDTVSCVPRLQLPGMVRIM